MAGFVVRDSVVVDASPRQVWDVFAAVERWPHWNPVCRSAEHVSDEDWVEGAVFRYSFKPAGLSLKLIPTVVSVQPRRHVTWVAHFYGTWMRQTFEFDRERQGTRITYRGVVGGPLLWLIKRLVPKKQLETATHQWLEALRDESERTAAILHAA